MTLPKTCTCIGISITRSSCRKCTEADAVSLLQQWLSIFEAAGSPVASGNPQDNPVLAVMGDTREFLRQHATANLYCERCSNYIYPGASHVCLR